MKKNLITGIVFLMICIMSTLIYAAIDAKVIINSSASTVKPGDEVTFTIKMKDIVSENGANGIEGTITYDTDKFEELKSENVTRAGSWDVAYFNGKVIAEGLSAIKSDSDVINIKLKVKNDSSLEGKTASVSFNNTVVYNTEKVELGTISASVKIEDESSNQTPTETEKPTPTPTATTKPGGSESTPTPSTKPNNTGTPTPTSKPNSGENKNDVPVTNIDTNTSSGNGTSSTAKPNGGSTTTSGTTIKGSTTASTSLPKAGISTVIGMLSVVVVSFGTVAYIKLRKYNEI